MAIFGCDFLQFLNRHVVLPENENEETVFDEFHQQKKPLILTDDKFESALDEAIKAIEEEINQQKIIKPKTDKEKKKNQVLYNKKRTLIRSMLRNYFKELDVSKEQWKWLGGKLKVKVGNSTETFSIY